MELCRYYFGYKNFIDLLVICIELPLISNTFFGSFIQFSQSYRKIWHILIWYKNFLDWLVTCVKSFLIFKTFFSPLHSLLPYNWADSFLGTSISLISYWDVLNHLWFPRVPLAIFRLSLFSQTTYENGWRLLWVQQLSRFSRDMFQITSDLQEFLWVFSHFLYSYQNFLELFFSSCSSFKLTAFVSLRKNSLDYLQFT